MLSPFSNFKKKNENLCNDIGKVNYSLFLLVLY